MDDGTALLAAIRLHPDEDVPRLVYADWLTENDQPERGEFIRVQCDLARLNAERSEGEWFCPSPRPRNNYGTPRHPQMKPCGVCCPCVLVARERELLAANESRWRFEFLPALMLDVTTYNSTTQFVSPVCFHRGFIVAIELTAANWLTYADAILAANPVQEVTLTTIPEIQFRPASGGRIAEVVRLIDRTWRAIPDGNGERGRTVALLESEWPGVKTWHLPPVLRIEGLQSLARAFASEYREADFTRVFHVD